MPSTDALSQTLTSITATKLAELSKQRAAFEAKKKTILESANKQSTPHARVSVLLDGLRRLGNEVDDDDSSDDSNDDSNDDFSDDSDDSSVTGLTDDSLKNIKRFLNQSKFDPSVPASLLAEWEQKLKKELETQSIKHRNAFFFGQLVTEWLENPDSIQGDGGDVVASTDSFEEVGRKEMHEQRKEWESLVFQASDTDTKVIEKYLNDLFMSTKSSRKAVGDLRKKVKKYGNNLRSKKSQFNAATLDWCIKGLLKSDGLTGEKSRILTEISTNESVVMEVADVLNMRLAALDEWSWPPSGVPVEQRRSLNGKYRVFMDEDLLDSLLLYYLGMVWAVTFRRYFVQFFKLPAWKKWSKVISKRDRDRRTYFLGDVESQFQQPYGPSIPGHPLPGRYNPVSTRGAPPPSTPSQQDHRLNLFEADYFMSQLPRSYEGAPKYDSDHDSAPGTAQKSPIEVKQSLLHLLSTDSLIATSLHGNFTVICSDFKWFGPSLSFNSIFTVLKFFGVSDDWINFFMKFLKAPLKFVQDGPRAQVQVRKRGVPINHVLSDLFGETMLFCMDFAVNQLTDGSYLYRLHDDFWFWGREETCGKAWQAMTQFARVMGIEFNEEKTGTVRLTREGGKPVTHGSLPKGDVRWGFLKLDAYSGRFLIDQDQVDEHITELKRQLSACKSVFAWVQAWNSYLARFFVTNFGKPANCFGRAHVDMVLETFNRIQRRLFAEIGEKGVFNVTDYLRKVIKERFQVDDLPDGFFFLPVNMGGLELRNPFIPMFAIRETICKDPRKKLEKAFDKDEVVYNQSKDAFEKGVKGGNAVYFEPGTFKDEEDKKTFFSLSEYNKYREETSSALLATHKELLMTPKEKEIDETLEVTSALVKALGDEAGPRASTTWAGISPYEKWVLQLYATEVIQKFGGLRIVDKGAVPLGVVTMLRSGKVKWQG